MSGLFNRAKPNAFKHHSLLQSLSPSLTTWFQVALPLFLSACAPKLFSEQQLETITTATSISRVGLCTDGAAAAFAESDTTLYLGGNFTQVGACSGGGVLLDTTLTTATGEATLKTPLKSLDTRGAV